MFCLHLLYFLFPLCLNAIFLFYCTPLVLSFNYEYDYVIYATHSSYRGFCTGSMKDLRFLDYSRLHSNEMIPSFQAYSISDVILLQARLLAGWVGWQPLCMQIHLATWPGSRVDSAWPSSVHRHSEYNSVLAIGRWSSVAGKLTAGLVKRNDRTTAI